MKLNNLRNFSEKLEQLSSSQGLTPKELAKKAGMSYSSLIPILNGSRECGISKLLALSEALDCSPNVLLEGLYESNQSSGRHQQINKAPSKYLAVFISIIKMTYCAIYEVESDKTVSATLSFSLLCGAAPDEFLDHLILSLQSLSKEFGHYINPKDVAVFCSVQQYGRINSRKKIQMKGEHIFAKFLLESDAITNHHAFLGKKNGICISINDGDAITYSIDHGKTIAKLHGYGFPISDVAGNKWIGCQAIRHAINVREGVESGSSLSESLLLLFDNDADFFESVIANADRAFIRASNITKEFIFSNNVAKKILEESYLLLEKQIKVLDEKLEEKLPIVITGEMGSLYKPFFSKNRLLKNDLKDSEILTNFGIEKLKLTL
jgi:N-acetylglucosamine kinase-like BadF-type ATPase